MTAFLAILLSLLPLDEAGYQKTLQSYRGKVVLVNFWATWCSPCREEMPALAALYQKLRDRGFVLITVSADEAEQEQAAVSFLKKSGAPMPGYRKQAKSDEDFINSVDHNWSGALPALFLYDRSGKKVKSFIGEKEKSEIEAAVRKLL